MGAGSSIQQHLAYLQRCKDALDQLRTGSLGRRSKVQRMGSFGGLLSWPGV
jgi:hypothetical protein